MTKINISGNNLYEDLKDFLRDEIIEVAFTKKNGEDRVMKCTLMPKEIPAELAPKNIGNPPDEENRDYLNVFDVEAQGWRSFILSSVKYVKTNLNESV
jgi:hypothetical protein